MRLNLMIALLKGFECRFFIVLFITLANPKAEQDLVGWESLSNITKSNGVTIGIRCCMHIELPIKVACQFF